MNINEIIAAVENPPTSFEEYLNYYAERVGELVNAYLPTGTHPDMDRYLYDPLKAYSKNGGKRHRPLICFAACLAVGGNVVTDAFGIVALVALAPLLAVQIMGLVYQRARANPRPVSQGLPEDTVVDMEEES